MNLMPKPLPLVVLVAAIVMTSAAFAGPPCADCPDWGEYEEQCWQICTSPIAISLLPGELKFTGVDKPVRFDIDADGELETLSWTDPESLVGLLVLDRNGNGLIDDGTELFGEHSPQAVSAEPNGFEALGFYDRPDAGGNGDGWISATDAIFPLLRIWRDTDHNGVSDPSELTTLKAWKIHAISIAYSEPRQQDEHGNWLWWTGQVQFEDGQRPAATDVFFLEVK